MEYKKYVIWLVLIASFLLWQFSLRPVRTPSGVVIPYKPKQGQVPEGLTLELDGFTITPLATFDIDSKVLSIEKYRHDDFAAVSKLDFALGWGIMSDQDIVDQVNVSQSGRWYRWNSDLKSLNRSEVSLSSANMHLIAANPTIYSELKSISVGQIVSMTGYLVKVEENGTNNRWVSSLTRRDTGGGACEVFWVEEVSVINII